MRALTASEAETLSARENRFEAFYPELIPVLVEFVDRLGVTPAHAVLTDAPAFAPLLASLLSSFSVEGDDDRVWLVARVAYYVGEYLAQKHGGCWFVNDDPDSATFARFVVGQFVGLGGSTGHVDPFAVAAEYVDALPGADLEGLLTEIDAALEEASGRRRPSGSPQA